MPPKLSNSARVISHELSERIDDEPSHRSKRNVRRSVSNNTVDNAFAPTKPTIAFGIFTADLYFDVRLRRVFDLNRPVLALRAAMFRLCGEPIDKDGREH